ncbi:uncharacterized protein L201_007162 [Kwoniella dendrophila CBS 6074]|uniref:Ima1 N-terminal domain-containing protein n=1 Tax=Kwoniella dendrophila CBS 6074 TaxID=1295534 RepID=A0AAX4K553_9TREE
MPLLRSSTRPTAVQCFFCLSPSLLPPQSSNFASSSTSTSKRDVKGKSRIAEVGSKWNWQCEKCRCWIIRDERGEMISDLPAMHDTAFNEQSFSLRATPSSSHLPSSSSSSSSTSPFCHSCLANQTLIMNMLANYLPDDDDPSYPMLYNELPNYIAKLQSRYPPVCRNCQPAVDEALRKSDHRAQVQAWSSALDRGFKSTHGVKGSNDSRDGSAGRWEVIVWRIRGILWWIGLALSILQGILAIAFPSHLRSIISVQLPYIPPIPMSILSFYVLSIIWTAWDPYWLKKERNKNKIKIEGRDVWVRNMLLIMVLRIIGSTAIYVSSQNEGPPHVSLKVIQAVFTVEIALLIHALISIRISQPVSIKLVRPVSLTSSPAANTPIYSISPHPSTPSGTSPSYQLLHSHSRPGNSASANPIFGQPSLHQPVPDVPVEGEPMDWEPTRNASYQRPLFSPEDEDVEIHFSSSPQAKRQNWDKFGTNKQRMFYNQNETGLENLLAGWGIDNSDNHINSNGQKSKNADNNGKIRNDWKIWKMW